jgi:hypothetical protein
VGIAWREYHHHGSVHDEVWELVAGTLRPAAAAAGSAPPAGTDVITASVQALADQLKIKPADIKVTSVEDVMWPNSCLGNALPNQKCLDVITPGYKIILSANGQTYEYHADQTGRKMQLAQPAAVQQAIQALAQELKLDAAQIALTSYEAVNWRDGCLEVRRPNQACTDVITPGYRVILAAGGKSYEYHTDQTGRTVIRLGK